MKVGGVSHPYHYVNFPFGKTQIWIQPIHQSLHLFPIEEDEKYKKQEVEHTETYERQENLMRIKN